MVGQEAQIDLEEAIDWYENHKKDLGIEFLLEFYVHSNFLGENPKIFQKIYSRFRRMVMRKFPYAIFYSIEEENKEIFIAAIWNTKRNPDSLEKRLK